jgi:hypothetical protein
MAIQTFPRPVNPKIKKQTDDQIAKVGQLNQLVKDVNGLNVTGPSPAGIPFVYWPNPGLTTGGTMFKYTDGVELLSYHIKGISSINNTGNGFEWYLCTVSFAQFGGLFPGSLTGMLQSGGGGDIVTSPLAVGGLVEVDGNHAPLTGLNFTLYDYGNNPQPDGNYYYALYAIGSVADSGNISALMTYDFEILLPNFVPAPTIFQD